MKRSVHFGMNQVSPASYGGWSGFLAGCWNDCEDMAASFAGLGYEARAFFDSECTLDKIRQEFLEASATLVAGDSFLFSDSGHGGQTLGILSGSTETLCLFDGQLADTELRSMIAWFKAGVNVAMVFDSCHSGGMDRAIQKVVPRVAPLWVTRNLPVSRRSMAGSILVTANAILFAACQRDEVAGDGTSNGLFTHSLLESQSAGMSWNKWMLDTQRFMSKNYPDQHPGIAIINGAMADNPVA